MILRSTKYGYCLVVLFCILFCSIRVTADTIIRDITIEPVNPAPLSTITFTITIDNTTTIQDVRLILQECRQDMCFVDKWNESMNMINGVYQTNITLIHKQATQFKYNIAIETNGTWFNFETAFINLSIDEQNNPPENNPDNNSTPGFELVLFFISVGLMLIKRQHKLKGIKK